MLQSLARWSLPLHMPTWSTKNALHSRAMSTGLPRRTIQPRRRNFFNRSFDPLLLDTLRLMFSGVGGTKLTEWTR